MFSDNDNLKDFVKEKNPISEIEMDPPRGELFFYNLIDAENVMNLDCDPEILSDLVDRSALKTFDEWVIMSDKFDWKNYV